MNMDKNSPYYSYMISVFSEKLLELCKSWSQKVNYSDTLSDDLMYYQNSNLGDHPDDSIDVIGIDTAIKLLLQQGANVFYIHDNTETILTKLLNNKNLKDEIKNYIIETVDVEKLCNLPIKWNNNIFHHLLISGEDHYLEKLIQKGLVFKQNEFYDINSYEFRALKYGNLQFFEKLLALNPESINFDHVYTYKEDYEEIPKEDANKITIRSEIKRLINDENVVDIGTNCYDTAKFLSKFLLHQDLQNKIQMKDTHNKKIKI